jgi:hypothetical protein
MVEFETGAEGRCAQSGGAAERFSQQAGRVVHSGCLREMGRQRQFGARGSHKAKAMGVCEDRGQFDASEARDHEQIPESARC